VRYGIASLIPITAFLWYYSKNKAWDTNLVRQTFTHMYVNRQEINVNHEFVHRFNSEKNIFHSLFYRMPLKEFNQLYRFRRVSVQGNFDHDKEVLIESNNHGERGYNVYTPFYFYDNTSIATANLMVAGDGSKFVEQRVERGGIVVHRGW
jgi:hypothetical protein